MTSYSVSPLRPLPVVLFMALFIGSAVTAVAEDGDAVPIFVSGQDRAYELLSDDITKLITVRGPGELRLVSRARFKPADEDGLSYRLRVRLDGGAWEDVVYENVGRSRTAMFRDGTLGMPGSLMDHRIRLSRGYHNIEVRRDAAGPDVFFRHLFKSTRAKARTWVPITPSDESELVDLVSREKVTSYFRNAEGKPFELDVIGPTELRIFTRLEHTPDMRGRVHYRLQIQRDGELVNTFQLNDRRSAVTTYRDLDTLVP